MLDAAALFVALPSWRTVSGPELLEGLILAESGGDPNATRFERRQDQQADGDSRDLDDGMREDDKSYGLMQVMGYNLRRLVGVPDRVKAYGVQQLEVPVPMDFSWALRPLANIAAGLRLLCAEIHVAETEVRKLGSGRDVPAVDVALARFNGGRKGNLVTDYPLLRNGAYVERIFEHAQRAQADRKAAGWQVAG